MQTNDKKLECASKALEPWPSVIMAWPNGRDAPPVIIQSGFETDELPELFLQMTQESLKYVHVIASRNRSANE